MRNALGLILLTLALSIGAVMWLHRDTRSANNAATLTLFCAVSLKKPMEAAAAAYRAETGVETLLQWGGSGTLLGQIQIAKRGDLLITADAGTLADARKLGLVRQSLPLVTQQPVFAVRTGNPKGIRALSDLLRTDVRLALANPEAASIGRSTRASLGEDWPALARHATVMKPTVTEIAGDLSLGAVDVAVLWDSTVRQFKGIEAVTLPSVTLQPEHASLAVLAVSAQPEAALRFGQFLRAPKGGGRVFKEHGFTLERAAGP